MQHRLAVSAFSVLLTLCACGLGPDSDTGIPPGAADSRRDIAGTYEIQGTLTLKVDEEIETRQVKDFLRVEPGGAFPGITLSIDSLGCGPEGVMMEEGAFSLGARTCPLAAGGSCTFELLYEEGRGSSISNAPPTIQVELSAQLVTTCGEAAARGEATLELSGPRRRLTAPEPREEALGGRGALGESSAPVAREPTLREVLNELARSMSSGLE